MPRENLCADVSEHSSNFMGRTMCFETSAHKIQTPGNHPQENTKSLYVEVLDPQPDAALIKRGAAGLFGV